MSESSGNIYLIGFMGCGKSYWGRQLSKGLKIPVCDMDAIIEAKEQAKIADLFRDKGEAYFRQQEHQVLQGLIRAGKRYIVSCGGGTPCFNNNMALMNAHGATFYLKAGKDYLFNNLKINRQTRPPIAKLNDAELLHFIDTKLDERKVYYEQARYSIDMDNMKPFEFLQAVVNCMNRS